MSLSPEESLEQLLSERNELIDQFERVQADIAYYQSLLDEQPTAISEVDPSWWISGEAPTVRWDSITFKSKATVTRG